MSNANASPKSACASTRPMPTKSHVLDSSKASGWRWIEAIVCPNRYPIPIQDPMTAVPAANPNPTRYSWLLPWSSASSGGMNANISMYIAPLCCCPAGALVLLPVQGYLDINLRKNSEYVCLQHSYEDLEPEQRYRHRHRYCCHQ